jgi:hypothetical protein
VCAAGAAGSSAGVRCRSGGGDGGLSGGGAVKAAAAWEWLRPEDAMQLCLGIFLLAETLSSSVAFCCE